MANGIRRRLPVSSLRRSDARRCRSAVVRPCGAGSRLRDDRHPQHARVAGAQMGFVLLTAYTGVVGAFLYVLGCREPLPGTHEEYTATHWRQTLGSTMHCVAGDGIGILVGAVLSSLLGLTGFAEVALEYLLGFGFGWTIFQALFMRDAAGGSYSVALRRTFIPELLSMNLLMAGMVPTAMTLRRHVDLAGDPAQARFWFVMSWRCSSASSSPIR
jgi:hypothetical protein